MGAEGDLQTGGEAVVVTIPPVRCAEHDDPISSRHPAVEYKLVQHQPLIVPHTEPHLVVRDLDRRGAVQEPAWRLEPQVCCTIQEQSKLRRLVDITQVGTIHKEYGKAKGTSVHARHEAVGWAKAKAENLTATRLLHVEGKDCAEVCVVDSPPAKKWEDNRAARL